MRKSSESKYNDLKYKFPKTAATDALHERFHDCKIDALIPYISRHMDHFPRHLSAIHYVELLVGLVLLMPRLILWTISIILLNFTAVVVTFGLDQKAPSSDEELKNLKSGITGWRKSKLLFVPLSFFYRCVQFTSGIWHIKTVGKKCQKSEAAVAVCAPHSTMLDSALFCQQPFRFENLMSCVANDDLGMLSLPIRPTQPVSGVTMYRAQPIRQKFWPKTLRVFPRVARKLRATCHEHAVR